MQECSCPNKVVYTVSSIGLIFLTPLGLPAGTASCFSAALGPHTPLRDTAWGGSGPGCSTAFQGSRSALPPGHSATGEAKATSCSKCCFSNVRLQVQNARAWLFILFGVLRTSQGAEQLWESITSNSSTAGLLLRLFNA